MSRLKVGVFFAYLSIERGGVFSYANGLVNMLLKDTRVEKVVLFYSKDQEPYVRKIADTANKLSLCLVQTRERALDSRLAKAYNLFHGICDAYFTGDARGVSFLKGILKAVNPYKRLLEKASIDVLHVPVPVAPVYGIKCPVITTMHDVQELRFPEFFTPEDRVKRAVAHKRAIEKSDHIIVSFDHVKDDIVKYYGVSDQKVSVCSLPFADEWFQDAGSVAKDVLKRKYALPEHFILYPAVTWPHKNHIELINALKILGDKGVKVNLVCTGSKTAYLQKIVTALKRFMLEDQVVFLGIVPEGDLIGLYRMADLVVIPTLYEAGSGPLFEAMRYGAPAICSAVTSLPDTMANPEFTFDPKDAHQMARLIEKGCFDSEFRQRNKDNLNARKLHYKSLNSSDAFLDAYSLSGIVAK